MFGMTLEGKINVWYGLKKIFCLNLSKYYSPSRFSLIMALSFVNGTRRKKRKSKYLN